MTLVRNTAAAVLAVLAATAAEAALPPYYQRALEFETILKNAEVARALSGKGPIDSLSRIGEDSYEIEAGSCTLAIKVVTDPDAEQRPGPRRITLEVGAPECR
ncbi:hypothetical protein [Methylopila sp. M107]|uniref:hypothetical protein n=1 Tax=Methylopila sp. M107 TaxID=1101190 RepID=UPI000375CA1A|nr:hypothetical protein [Methylopila sp. M107]